MEIGNRKLICDKGVEVTPELVQEYIEMNNENVIRYEELESEFLAEKEEELEEQTSEVIDRNKPDENYIAPHGRYLVNNFDGYFISKQPKVIHENEEIQAKINEFDAINNVGKHNTQQAKMASVYAIGIELQYLQVNSENKVENRITHLNPKNAFIVYDNSADEEKVFGVHVGEVFVTVSTEEEIIRYIYDEDDEGVLVLADIEGEINPQPNIFGEIPMTEFLMNEERVGLYEPVMTLIQAYNKILSSKGNDIDYFADQYLHIHTPEDVKLENINLKEDRTIHTWGENRADVGFVARNSADQTQENTLDRIEDKIFQLSNVVDMANDNVGQSGYARETRLNDMSNQALNKQAQFDEAIKERYRLMLKTANIGTEEDYQKIDVVWFRNEPRNLEAEANIFRLLKGGISDETLFGLMSFIESPEKEKELIQEEREQGTFVPFDNTSRISRNTPLPQVSDDSVDNVKPEEEKPEEESNTDE